MISRSISFVKHFFEIFPLFCIFGIINILFSIIHPIAHQNSLIIDFAAVLCYILIDIFNLQLYESGDIQLKIIETTIRKYYLSLICGILISAAMFSAIEFISMTDEPDISSDCQAGLNYLSTAEKADSSVAEDFFRDKIKDRLALKKSNSEREALINDIKNHNVDVFPLFKDYLILGDSRALGFSYFKFLSYSRVFAGGGDTILKVREHMDKIKILAPTYIYLCYGLNDAGIGIWKTPEDYANDVLSVINELRQALPDSKIYYNSIIWISDGAASYAPWAQIYDYSAACRVMCEQNGIHYIDNDEICKLLRENKWWSGDGIHLCEPFYKFWAENLYLAILED